MWLQLLLFDNPPKHGRVADQAARRYVEAFLHALQHGLGRLDLLGSMRGCRFDIHNDSGLHIDQISVRPETAKLLERIYRDEIGHVAYGLKWFRRWRNPNESERLGGVLKYCYRQLELAFPLGRYFPRRTAPHPA